jgi:hydrogenase nickel incorporation protein HypA/HybF
MHELQVAREIVNIVTRTMAERELTYVETVAVRIGALSCVNPDALAFGFEAAKADTAIEQARLEITRIPVSAGCKLCGRKCEIELPTFACSHCSGTDLVIIAGEELHIDYIIGE